MQKRSGDRWLGVWCTIASVGLIVQLASPSSAWAAPKKKKKAHAEAAAAAEPEPEPVAPASSEGKDVDSLMKDSATTKRKSVQQSRADSESEARESSTASESAHVGEPDAWEKPPPEQEKPKKSKFAPKAEEKKGDGRNIAIEIRAGYGFQTSKYFSDDPYGLGAGIRGSYEFDSHLVVGLGGQWFLGNSHISNVSVGVAAPVTQVSTEANYWLGFAEVGYDFWFGNILLEPSLWVGLAWGVQDPPLDAAGSGVVTSLFFAPGLTFDYLLGDNGWYLGADIHFMIITGDGAGGIPLVAQFGKRF